MTDATNVGEAVSLEAVLAARERRAERQRRLREAHRCPVFSMTVNMPGAVKRTAHSALFFDRQRRRVEALIEASGGTVEAREVVTAATGDEALWAVRGLTPVAMKRMAVDLETASPAARLLDLDVIDRDGAVIDRARLGWSPRTCLICDRPAHECRIAGRHAPGAAADVAARRLETFARGALADDFARMAAEASSFELLVSPKPGLVTPDGQGAHDDMDRFSFAKSQAVLVPYYRRAFAIGWTGADAARLRRAGMLAEADMMGATRGVNTHRGWIYLSGLIGAALGAKQATDSTRTLRAHVTDMAHRLEEVLADEAFAPVAASKGPVVGGIRAEALGGLPHIFELGVPVLRASRMRGEDDNTAGLRALVALLAVLDDTTLSGRGGIGRAKDVRRRVSDTLSAYGDDLAEGASAMPEPLLTDFVRSLDRVFVRDRLSCGGVADALAASRLLDRLLHVNDIVLSCGFC